jgi:hypothetical protein
VSLRVQRECSLNAHVRRHAFRILQVDFGIRARMGREDRDLPAVELQILGERNGSMNACAALKGREVIGDQQQLLGNLPAPGDGARYGRA